MQLLVFFAVVKEDKNKRVIMQRRTAPVIFCCMRHSELIAERVFIVREMIESYGVLITAWEYKNKNCPCQENRDTWTAPPKLDKIC